MHKSTISQPERNLRYRFASSTLIFGRRTRRANHPWLKSNLPTVQSALRCAQTGIPAMKIQAMRSVLRGQSLCRPLSGLPRQINELGAMNPHNRKNMAQIRRQEIRLTRFSPKHGVLDRTSTSAGRSLSSPIFPPFPRLNVRPSRTT